MSHWDADPKQLEWPMRERPLWHSHGCNTQQPASCTCPWVHACHHRPAHTSVHLHTPSHAGAHLHTSVWAHLSTQLYTVVHTLRHKHTAMYKSALPRIYQRVQIPVHLQGCLSACFSTHWPGYHVMYICKKHVLIELALQM